MQKNASPRSCVAAYWRKPPIRLPRCLSPVGWMPEKILTSFLSVAGRRDRDERLSVSGARFHGGGRRAPEERQAVKRTHGECLAILAPGVKNACVYTARMAVTEREWAPDSWRALAAGQQPEWPDAAALASVRDRLRQLPPLVFAGEARNLLATLGEVS